MTIKVKISEARKFVTGRYDDPDDFWRNMAEDFPVLGQLTERSQIKIFENDDENEYFVVVEIKEGKNTIFNTDFHCKNQGKLFILSFNSNRLMIFTKPLLFLGILMFSLQTFLKIVYLIILCNMVFRKIKIHIPSERVQFFQEKSAISHKAQHFNFLKMPFIQKFRLKK